MRGWKWELVFGNACPLLIMKCASATRLSCTAFGHTCCITLDCARRATAIEDQRCALAQRKVQLFAALEDADARVRQATGPAHKERQAVAARCEEIQVRLLWGHACG